MRNRLALLLLPFVATAELTVQQSTTRGFKFRYVPGAASVDSSGEFAQVAVADAGHHAQPGEIDLPSKRVRVGIPQHGGVRVSFVCGPQDHIGRGQPAFVPRLRWDGDGYPDPRGAPEADGPSTQPSVVAGPVEVLRSVRFVTLELAPIGYDVSNGELTLCRWIDVSVEFESEADVVASPEPLDGWVASALVNGREAVFWKLTQKDAPVNPFLVAPNWLRVEVESTGLYCLTGARLSAAGVTLAGIDPATLAVYTIGEHTPNSRYPDSLTRVPLLLSGADGGRLEMNDSLLFYGLGPNHWQGVCSSYVRNLYTDKNVYWLVWGGDAGLRMRRGLQPDTAGTSMRRSGIDVLHQEVDTDCPARSGLLWIWAGVHKSADEPVASFKAVLPLRYPIEVTRMGGSLIATKGANRLYLYLNGRSVAMLEFNQAPPSSPYCFSVDTTQPASYSSNTLGLELRGDGEKQLYLDYLEVTYRRRLSLAAGQLHFNTEDTGVSRYVVRDVSDGAIVLDVTDPYQPRQILGYCQSGESLVFSHRAVRVSRLAVVARAQLLTPSSLELRHPGRFRDRSVRADYWVVSPAEFLPVAAELAAYRTGRIPGFLRGEARPAALELLYDDYCLGMAEPWAVKAFFADKRPSYGLLVGDATYDYRNRLGAIRPPGVPAYEIGLGLDPDGTSDRSALAIDACYADFEGEGGSPDMALGRVTARSAAELRQFLDKLVAYESGPAGLWTRRYILLADDEFMGDPTNPRKWDPIGFGHVEYCEAVSVMPGDVLDPVKVYLTEYPYLQTKNKPGADAELMRQLNLGGVIWVFFGHGAAHDLTHESVLGIGKVRDIKNGGRVPFCYFGSCSVGRFDDTKYEAISEELVRMPGGAIATIGATKCSAAGSNLVFARNLLTPLFAYPESTIGYSFFQAWPTDRTYHLFGDPATVLRMPRLGALDLRFDPDTLRPGSPFRCEAVVDLPAGSAAWSLRGPRRVRRYVSVRGSVTYSLPGSELARGTVPLSEGRLRCAGVFPMGSPLDTVFVHDGFYAPVPQSCELAASVWNESLDLALLVDTLRFAVDPVAVRDENGPQVRLHCGGAEVIDGSILPSQCRLEGSLFDQSGILIAPVPDATPEFYLGHRRAAVDLTDQLVFDDSLFTTARFQVPLDLKKALDTLWVACSDNLLNRTVYSVAVRSGSAEVLRVESTLVYPNPTAGQAVFTFRLNRPASVRVRLFTLSGRFVRDLGEAVHSTGYGQVAWDGCDRDGLSLPNGVYLYTLAAVDYNDGTNVQRVTVRDRFIIRR